MNDFTKEELEIIIKIYEYGGPVGTYIEGMGHLINKIQSMIDNYCEHSSSTSSCIKIDGVSLLICSKCGVAYCE